MEQQSECAGPSEESTTPRQQAGKQTSAPGGSGTCCCTSARRPAPCGCSCSCLSGGSRCHRRGLLDTYAKRPADCRLHGLLRAHVREQATAERGASLDTKGADGTERTFQTALHVAQRAHQTMAAVIRRVDTAFYIVTLRPVVRLLVRLIAHAQHVVLIDAKPIVVGSTS